MSQEAAIEAATAALQRIARDAHPHVAATVAIDAALPYLEPTLKAEALREAAGFLSGRVEGLAVALLLGRADFIERGEIQSR